MTLEDMRFEAEHRFQGTPSQVAALLADPGFYETLDLSDVGRPTILETSSEGPRSVIRLRYEYTGQLNNLARRIVGNRLVWIQQVTVDRSTHSGDLTFNAEIRPKQLHGSAHFDLKAADEGCVRHLDGELVVAVPIVGSQAERRVVPGILRQLNVEAQKLDERLGRGC